MVEMLYSLMLDEC